MIQIHSSETIAQLLPELYSQLDPDSPMDTELSVAVSRFIRMLLLRTFRQLLVEDPVIELRWVLVLKKDPLLQVLKDTAWDDIEVLDSQGTFIITYNSGSENDN